MVVVHRGKIDKGKFNRLSHDIESLSIMLIMRIDAPIMRNNNEDQNAPMTAH